MPKNHVAACGHRKSKHLTGCCHEPGHKGAHVYCSIGKRSLQYYHELEGGQLRAALFADLKPGKMITEEEAQALWQYMEYVRRERAKKQGQR